MSVNKWIFVQMVIIITLSFFLGYRTHQIESDGFNILPEWIANSSISEFAFAHSGGGESAFTLKDLKEVQQAFTTIENQFISDDISKQQLIDGAISGGVVALNDNYSRYVSPEESKKVREDITGFYGGIGILVEALKNGKGTLITSVFKSSPAYDAGLQAGDIIVKVEDKDVSNISLQEVVALIKGPLDTKVKITVYRPVLEDTLEFDVLRKEVKYPSVFEKKILDGTDKIGYIQLIQFNNESAKDMREALDELIGKGMKSLILDLRQNTGGSFGPSVEIADMFVGDGVLVYTEGKDHHMIEYKSRDGGKKLNIPLVVLVDNYSASASEILAGAIKDHHDGTIMGSTTFGKGVVQSVSPLPSGGTLILTTSKYLTPEKHDINKIGIKPDITAEVDFEKTSDPFLKEKYQKAEELRQEIIKIRDELVQYLKKYDLQLEVAKRYLKDGELIEGAYVTKDEEKTSDESAATDKPAAQK